MQRFGSEYTETNRNRMSCDELNSKQVKQIITQETAKVSFGEWPHLVSMECCNKEAGGSDEVEIE